MSRCLPTHTAFRTALVTRLHVPDFYLASLSVYEVETASSPPHFRACSPLVLRGLYTRFTFHVTQLRAQGDAESKHQEGCELRDCVICYSLPTNDNNLFVHICAARKKNSQTHNRRCCCGSFIMGWLEKLNRVLN